MPIKIAAPCTKTNERLARGLVALEIRISPKTEHTKQSTNRNVSERLR